MPRLQVHLIALEPDSEGQGERPEFVITHFPCALGRHPACAIRLNDSMVSRRHCAFSLHDGRVCVEDLGSRNGTRLNGEPITSACPVKDGDRLEVASQEFRIRLAGAPAEGEATGDASAVTNQAARYVRNRGRVVQSLSELADAAVRQEGLERRVRAQ